MKEDVYHIRKSDLKVKLCSKYKHVVMKNFWSSKEGRIMMNATPFSLSKRFWRARVRVCIVYNSTQSWPPGQASNRRPVPRLSWLSRSLPAGKFETSMKLGHPGGSGEVWVLRMSGRLGISGVQAPWEPRQFEVWPPKPWSLRACDRNKKIKNN